MSGQVRNFPYGRRQCDQELRDQVTRNTKQLQDLHECIDRLRFLARCIVWMVSGLTSALALWVLIRQVMHG